MIPIEFRNHLIALAQQASKQGTAAAMPGVAKRPWQLPPAYPLGVDVQDPAGVMTGCNRSSLNSACLVEYANGFNPNSGRLGVVGALKTAIDYQAAYERALHARHASPVRLRVWASARRQGHQDMTYGVFGCVMRSLDAAVDAAQSAPNSQMESSLGGSEG